MHAYLHLIVYNYNTIQYNAHSYLEIYNEQVRDLLTNTPTYRASLRVREHPDTGPYVEGMVWYGIVLRHMR